MSIVATQIELQTQCDSQLVRLSNVEKFNDGSGYRCNLTVRSGGFACDHQFYFDDHALVEALISLRQMSNGAVGVATIKFRYEFEFIRLETNRLGHVFVSGELFERSERLQSLKFSFRTDQTVLGPLITELQKVHDA